MHNFVQNYLLLSLKWQSNEIPTEMPRLTESEINRCLLNQIKTKKERFLKVHRKVEWALSRLEEFEGLKDNWDSYGAEPIEPFVIEEARSIFKSIKKINDPQLFKSLADSIDFYPIPTSSGGVTIYLNYDVRELRLKLRAEPDTSIVIRVTKSEPLNYSYEQSTFSPNQFDSNCSWLISGLLNEEPRRNLYRTKTTYISESATFISTEKGIFRMKPLSLESRADNTSEMIAVRRASIGTDIQHLWIQSQGPRSTNAKIVVH